MNNRRYFVVYEWAIYTDCTEIQEEDGSTSIDYDGDVNFHDTYAGVADRGEPDEINVIELQRSHWSQEDRDLIERYYAVVKDGKLPEFFKGTQIRIPQKFHKELQFQKELKSYNELKRKN